MYDLKQGVVTSDEEDEAEQDIGEEDEVEEVHVEQEVGGDFRDMVEEENTYELDEEGSGKLDEERSVTSKDVDEEPEMEYSDDYNTSTGCDSETDGGPNTSIKLLYDQPWMHQEWEHKYRPSFDLKQPDDNGRKLNLHEGSGSGVEEFDRDITDSLGIIPRKEISKYKNTHESAYEVEDANVNISNVYNSSADYEGVFEFTDDVNAENENNMKLKLSSWDKYNLTKDMPRRIISIKRSEDNIASDINISQSYTESEEDSPGLTGKQEYSPFRVSRHNLEANLNNRLQSKVKADADKVVRNVFENSLEMWDQSDSHSYVTNKAENRGIIDRSCVESSGNSPCQSETETAYCLHSNTSDSDSNNYVMNSNFPDNRKKWDKWIFRHRSENDSNLANKTDDSLTKYEGVRSNLEEKLKRDLLWRCIIKEWNWLRKKHLSYGDDNPFWRQPPTEEELLDELDKREQKNKDTMYGKEEKASGKQEGFDDSDSWKTPQTPQRVSAVQEYINKEWKKYQSKYQYLGQFSSFNDPPPDPSFLLTYFSPRRRNDQHRIEEKPVQANNASDDSSPHTKYKTQNFDQWTPFSDTRLDQTFQKQIAFQNPLNDPFKSRTSSPTQNYNKLGIPSYQDETGFLNIRNHPSSVTSSPPKVSGDKTVMIFKNPHWPKSEQPNGNSLKHPKTEVPAYGVRQKGPSEFNYSTQGLTNNDYFLQSQMHPRGVEIPYRFASVSPPTQPFYYPHYPLPYVYPGFPLPGQLDYGSALHQHPQVEVDQKAYGQSNPYGRHHGLPFQQNHPGLIQTDGKDFNSNTRRQQGTRNISPEQPPIPSDQYNTPFLNTPPMPYYWPYMQPQMFPHPGSSRIAYWGHQQPPENNPTVEESLRYLDEIRTHNERDSTPNDFIRNQTFHQNRGQDFKSSPDLAPREES